MCLLNMRKGIFKPRKNIDLVVFTGFNKGEEYCSRMSADFIATEEPVFSADDEGLNSERAHTI